MGVLLVPVHTAQAATLSSDAAALVRAGCRMRGNGSTVNTQRSRWVLLENHKVCQQWIGAGEGDAGTCSPPGVVGTCAWCLCVPRRT